MLKRTTLSFMWVMISACLIADVTHAAIRLPNGCKPDVFLTITGKIDRITNSADSSYEMSEREFLALPTSTVTTSTPWTPKSDFVGPLLTKILQEVAAKGSRLRLVALDDFSVEVDGDFLGKYGTILASSKDGVRLTVRDFGPIFVMYPRDSFKQELDTPFGASHMVWQLCGIEVE
ncbi:oxidoreductase [Rhizobium rhizogenes]|uniref:oxidoreductase n=1 Tax=Rhizobium rhizogenes TaxID=359 RepID=UPI001571E912|nr:oxidoreductase [Rhizobium rhizogenes]NTF65995.1 oxidoreductase [Rhizobium rhizogenes]NTG97380.1 oxidoreductase [Rhizobium rhizogenes]